MISVGLIDDQFLLGNRTLVAPVLEPTETSRPVYLPTGRWRSHTGHIHVGPMWLIDFHVAIDDLAVFDLIGRDDS